MLLTAFVILNITINKLLPIFLYFIIVAGIGAYSAQFSSKGVSEFFIGGRQMGRFVVALSAVASGRSAWLLVGISGLAYLQGISAIWAVAGYIIIEFFMFLYLAPKLRYYSEKYDCITLPDFFSMHLNDRRGYLRIFLVFVFVVFMITYVSSQIMAGGKAFYTHFQLSENKGLIITALVILIYTITGGFLAVSLTDVFQAFVMLLALILLPLIALIDYGGAGSLISKLREIDPEFFNLFRMPALTIIGLLAIGLGSPGNPHIAVRYMSIKDPAQFRWTAIVGTIWNVLMAVGAILTGIVGRAYFPMKELLPNSDNENIYVSLSNLLLNPFFAGIILASLFAAIMSTADSQLLVAASSIVRDFYQKIILRDKSIENKKLTFLSRVSILFIIVLAIVLAFIIKEQILWFVLFAWGGLGASIGPALILSIFWKKTTYQGVIAGLITGTMSVFLWKNIDILKNTGIYELIPAFFLATIAVIIFSLITYKN